MNYDSVILELLTRVQAAEQVVKQMEEAFAVFKAEILERLEKTEQIESVRNAAEKELSPIGTQQIFACIEKMREAALANGKKTLTLNAGEIEKQLGVSGKLVLVVNAMKQAMRAQDRVISPPQEKITKGFTVVYQVSQQDKEIKDMRGSFNRFIIKRGKVPEGEVLNELGLYAGQSCLLAYTAEGECVGVVYEHFERRESAANGQAEICFFDRYYSTCGKWHRMFQGGLQSGKRICYAELVKMVAEDGSFEYSGYLRPKRG